MRGAGNYKTEYRKRIRIFRRKAIVFDSEEECNEAVFHNSKAPGQVIMLRYEGPKGGGMREMYKGFKLLKENIDSKIALITDGRFSGTNNSCL